MKKRLIALFLTLVMLVGMLPTGASAAETGSTPVGTVRVLVENNTALPAPNGGYGTWETDADQWYGVQIDQTVALYADSTMMTCIAAGLEGHSATGVDSGYITEIDGLKASGMAGWMGTLNDWFTSEGFTAYTYANGKLRDGDVIRLTYSLNYGPDVGSDYSSTDKSLASLTVDGAELNPAFAGSVSDYELVLGEAESAQITLNAAASNKNFLVVAFRQDMTAEQAAALAENSWYTASNAYRIGESITVAPEDVITVVVGAPNWPSMCNGTYGCGAEDVAPHVYHLRAVSEASDTSADFNAFFTALDGVATVANDTQDAAALTYPMQADSANSALVSTNGGVGRSHSGITLTFLKTAELSFSYKASSESKWDYLKIVRIAKNGTETILNENDKAAFSGDMSDYTVYTVQMQAGESLRVAYYKDGSGDKNQDCVWLKDFAVTLPHKVIFHANDGTDTTAEQGVFGTAALNGCTFTCEGYRFDGWATTQDGEVVYADGAQITLAEQDVELYAVWTKVWRVSFPNMPDGAEVTVKQGNEVLPISEADGAWLLPDGSYTYSAELFGYESKENVAFTVNGADLAVQDSLTPAARATVTFQIAGCAEGTTVSITVRNSENDVMEPTADARVYSLPAGEYTYTIEADGYQKIKAQALTVGAADQTVDVTLLPSNAWDGTVTAPQKTDGVYQIGNAAELAGFAKLVNDGEADADAVLTADIVLNEDGEWLYAWTPIASESSAAYSGSFTGAGYSISGLYIGSTASAVGLFGYIGANGSVSGLTIENANVKSTSTNYSGAYAALVAASNKGEISGVRLVASRVSGGSIVGGVAALNEGVVSGCGNESAVVEQNSAKDQGVGGIVGNNKGTVSLCYNKAHIVRGHSSANYAYLGGIVGNNDGSASVVESCYNHGEIDTAYYVGGIAGKASGTISDCYSTGTVPSTKKALVGSGYPTVTNCYYLDTCGASDTKGTAKTAEELKTLASELGGAFENTESYPRLKWENPNATYSVTLTVAPANAVVTVEGLPTPEPDTTTESGFAIYRYSDLPKGNYAWSVSCDTAAEDDYAPQSGTFALSVADVSKRVELEERTYDVTFRLSPVNAQLVLTADGETLTPKTALGEDGTVTYALPVGTYHYEATAFGYADASGEVTVVKTTGLAEQQITLVQEQSYTLTFTDVPDDAVITLTHETGGVQMQTSRENGVVTYTLVPAAYRYTVKRAGYKTLKGTATLEASDLSIAVVMTALGAWDGTVATEFADGDGTQAHPYEIESGEELAYLSALVAENCALISSATYYILTADIDMGGMAFTPIGADSGHTFSGHFNGNGHKISALRITTEGSNAGLFGRCSGSVEALTVENATVSGGNMYTGAIVGYLSGSLNDCTVKNSTILGSGDYTGGVVGASAVKIACCAVLDTTVSGTSHVGGVIGKTGQSVEKCYAARVNVSASGEYAGGILGSTDKGYYTIANLFVRGAVSAESYAGGILGGCTGYSSASLKNVYAVADVTATNGSYGALAAKSVNVTAASSFYCTESTFSGKTAVEGGTGKTTAELKNAEILGALGSEFAIYAQDGEFINGGLPYLVNAPSNTKVRPTSLTATTVVWTEKTASWTAVDNAVGYAVTLVKNGEEEPVFSEKRNELTCSFASVIDLNGSGSYTVSVTALGDGEFYGNAPAATATIEVTVVSGEVVFRVTRADGLAFAESAMPQITVTMADGTTTLTLENGVSKALPVGSYTYHVSAKTFAEQSGAFTLTESGVSIELALEYSPAWDGETTVEPPQLDGVYQISNGYELAWFRDAVNQATTESFALNAILTDHIDIGGHDWTAIAVVTNTSATKGYSGTFDGNGKTISNLKPVGNEVTSYSTTETVGAGLFGYVYTEGVVKNVTVAGSMEAVKYSGGVVAILAGGTVENCVNRMNLTLDSGTTNGYSIGGVVGYMSNFSSKTAYVNGCRNEGNITLGSNGRYVGGVVGNASSGLEIVNCENIGTVASGERTGGIVGSASIPVTACCNSGAVSAEQNQVGGIAGFANKVVKNCANHASVSGTNGKVGGIVGDLNSSAYGALVTGCLNSGAVSSSDESAETLGALVGTKANNDTAKTVERSYYLLGTCAKAIGGNASDADETTGVTQTELESKALIGLLGGAFASLADSTLPVLRWQNAAATPVVTFLVPDGAQIEVSGRTAAEGEPNAFVLTDGTYDYTVTKPEYHPANGSFTVNGESLCISVELAVMTYEVTFSAENAGATITVTDANGQVCEPTEENGSVYALPKGEYHYTVSKFGFVSVSGSFTVTGEALAIPQITLEGAVTYAVTFAVVDEQGEETTPTSVILTAEDGTVVAADSPNAYTLPDGNYTCTVEDSRYYTVVKHFAVNGAAESIQIVLEQNRAWDGTTQTAVTPDSDGIYEIGSAAELAWFAAQVNSGNTNLSAKLTANLYINYNGSENTWTPIGGYSNQYTGVFDGNGKTIHGLNAPLFGYNGANSLVKNLTVRGSVSGESNVGGICTASYGSFESCVNFMDVTASGQRVGGIVGLLYAGGHITDCANFGEITTSNASEWNNGAYQYAYLGGIVGMSYGAVTGCVNGGAITASSDSYGSSNVGGIVGELNGAPLTDCYNVGTISSAHSGGGIVGSASGSAAIVTDSYSVGTISVIGSAVNPQSGAVAGTLMNSASLNNCYFLKGAYTYVKGLTSHTDEAVGYTSVQGAWSAECKLASEMKLAAFAIALSPVNGSFHTDSEGVNNGYPVLAWQGGSVPVLSQDELDVAADKAALTVEPTTVTYAQTLTLAAQGANGSTITWQSSHPSIIAADGTVTLPADNEAVVTLTATITKGDVTDTKTFVITVVTQTAADLTALRALQTQLGTSFRVSYRTGEVNAAQAVTEKLETALTAGGITGLSAQEITVTVESAGTVSYGSGTLIDENGNVTYYYDDPATAINGDAIVHDVTFRLSTASGASVTTEACTVLIPWDQAKVKAALQTAADTVDFDTIRGENTDADAIVTDLTLPQRLDDYGWTLLRWTSSNGSVISVTGGEALTDFTGRVIAPEEDTAVTLTADFVFNKNNTEKDGEITLTKTVTVTVRGSSNDYMDTIHAALENFTAESLVYSAGENKDALIDPAAVTDDFRLPTGSTLGIDAGKNGYKLTYSAYSADGMICPITVFSYRAAVTRPIAETGTPVTLRLTVTKQNGGVVDERYSAYKELPLVVAPLKPSELDAELALLELVKENLFAGLNDGANAAPNAVVKNLHPFHEAYLDENGALIWAYDAASVTDRGIIATALADYDPMGSAQWRAFRSSDPSVITHENLLVTCPEQDDAVVTITMNLKSVRFGDYYEAYRDDPTYGAVFARLAGEEVVLTVTVISQAHQAQATAVCELISAIGEVTKDSGAAITAAREAYDSLSDGQKALIENYTTLVDAEITYAMLMATEPSEPTEPWSNPYRDVKQSAWYYEGVKFVDENGLMNGMGNGKFEPDTVMTRAMLVTVLWRSAGSPKAGKNTFTDVKNGQWFTAAIAWAAENGIVKGMGDNTFEPDTEITREQMATILYRYAKLRKADTSARDSLKGFADTGRVSAWAKEAMQWAVAVGVINGSKESDAVYLLPTEGATRAQVATMLMRYLEKID